MNNGKIRLNIDEDLFSNVYWKIVDIVTRFLILYGGTAAGKSFTVAQREVLLAAESYQKTLWIRKVGSTLKDSVYQSCLNRINEFGLTRFTTTTVKPMDIRFQKSGSVFLFRGLDDPEKLKSIEGITRIVIEEASELDYEDFKELNRRVRGIENIQIILIFNPIDEDHWLKKHFFDNILKNATLVHTTHHDNTFLLDSDHEEIEAMKDFDENQYNIYALGMWGKLKTGSEFLPHFSYVKHTGKCSFIPGKPIHLGFDFNVLPYQPMVCAQVLEGVVRWRNPRTKMRFKDFREGCEMEKVTQVRFFREYTGKAGSYPENTVVSVCEKFKEDFEETDPEIFYYGDASGKHNIAGKGDATNFKDVKAILKPLLNQASDRVPKSNPRVLKARDFLNRVLADKYPVELLFDDENCGLTAKDLATILLGKDGIHKEMVENKETKIKYQKNSHLHDCVKYMVVKLFFDLYKEVK